MGPTNVALVKLFQADQELRQAQSRLDAVTRDVRMQGRKIADLDERLKLAQSKLRENQSQAAQLDLDLKSRDAHIEKLRTQQQTAKTNREYQTFLVELNTAKVDRNKIEDLELKAMEQVETIQKEVQELSELLAAEQSKLDAMKRQIGDQTAALQSEIDALRPARESVASTVTPQARDAFERLAERFEGEALAALTRPHRRREEYVCGACNMDLVLDVYNKLHSRDELVFCPNCRRILYIPDDLPPEMAINKKEKREPKASRTGATVGRQTAATDILHSVNPGPEDPAPAGNLPDENAQA